MIPIQELLIFILAALMLVITLGNNQNLPRYPMTFRQLTKCPNQ